MGESVRSRAARLGAHPHAAATLLFALFVLAYLWPVLLGGKILSPIADLYEYPPWRAVAPGDFRQYVNHALLDLPLVDYPWRFLTRELLREGSFPAWDPYVFGGIPLFSNPQTGLFSPFNLPLWILPLLYALGVTAALKLVVAALGTYLLARRLRLGFLPGLLAGITFAFAAVNITWLAHETLLGVIAMLPWALLLVERLLDRARLLDAVLLALVIALGLSGGHPGMQLHLLILTSAYALVAAAFGARPAPRARALGLIGAGLALGMLLMAFMLVPEVRSSHETVGVLSRQHARLPAATMPFGMIRTVAFPDWWGRPGSLQPELTEANARVLLVNYTERTFYAGAVALLLAGVGLLAPGAWRRKAPFAILGALGLAVALRAPGLYWLATHLPVLRSVQPQRLHVAFALAVAVLGAFGLQAVIDAPARRRWLLAPLVALAGGLVALAVAGEQPGDLGRTVEHFVSGTDFGAEGVGSDGVLAMTSVVWFLLFAAGVGALLLIARLRPRWAVPVAVAVLLLAALDMQHFVRGFHPMGPQSVVVPPRTPAIAYLERHRDEGRVVGFQGALPNDWPLVYGLRDVRGYDPPQPTRRLLALWRHVNPDQVEWLYFSVPALRPGALHVLGVLGARYVVAAPEVTLEQSGSFALRTVYSGADATIAVNAQAVPRAYVPRRVLLTAQDGTDERIAEAAFDPRTSVAVERDQPGAAAIAAGAPTRGSATVVRERNASVTLDATLARRGLVVLDDALIDGWSVHVDGHPAEPVRVDGVLRGAIVPAGRHVVEWRYAVPGLRLGLLLSVLALLALAAAAGHALVSGRAATRARRTLARPILKA
jgi:hypothetical protein